MDNCDVASATAPPPSHPRRPTTLHDVLRELDVRALDTLHTSLTFGSCLGTARLACHALRQAVDGSVRKATITVRPTHAQSWRPGQLSPLTRFPRCTEVYVDLRPDRDAEGSEDEVKDAEAFDLAALMGISFAGVDTSASRRITSLGIDTFDWAESALKAAPDMYALVTALAPRLPSLRELNLQNLCGEWSGGGVRQAATYDLLAANCPQLKSLTIPNCRALLGVEALRSSLTSLCITGMDDDGSSGPLSRCHAANIAQLHQLRRLCVRYWVDDEDDGGGDEQEHGGGAERNAHGLAGGGSGGAPVLFRCLPPSVVRLEIEDGMYGGDYLPEEVAFTMNGGRVEAVSVEHSVHMSQISTMASMLLSSSVLLPLQLPLLKLLLVELGSADLTLQPLRELLARCGRVEVGGMCLSGDEPEGLLIEAARLFGGLPQQLQFQTLDVEIRTAQTQLTLLGRGAPRRALLGEVSPPELLCIAAQRIWSASAASGGSGDSGSGGNSSGGNGSPGSGGTPLVLLRGSVIGMLSSDPVTLGAWLAWLGKQAGSSLGIGVGAVEGDELHVIKVYQAVPAAAAVLVRCECVAAATALAAAAVTAAAGAGLAGSGQSAVVLSASAALGDMRWYLAPSYVLALHLQQVLQMLWDNSTACGELSVEEQLERLRALCVGLRKALPKEVRPGI